MNKKKILIIFKSPWLWNHFLVKKLSKFYIVDHLYISDIKNKNFIETTEEINKRIENNKIEIVFFDTDYYKFINHYFIKRINSSKKVLITFDDYDLHEMNSITASACDLVITGCPVSVLKYQEKGYQAHRFFLENDQDVYKDYKEKKDIDIIFFGALSKDRNYFINYLEKNGLTVKTVGSGVKFLKDEDLAKLISRSKIVLNFSKSTWGAVRSYSRFQFINPDKIYNFFYQFKGRILTAALCGTACVSEFFAGNEIMFSKNELKAFFTKEECLVILNELLKDDNLLKEYTNNFIKRALKLADDDAEFKQVRNILENSKHPKVQLANVPYWYIRIAAKQVVIRNIKLSTIIKTLLNFNIISSLVKESNYLTKFLVISESIINVLWYAIIISIKSKKF